MKRLFFAALLMLVISAFVVAPTFAMDACDHEMTHEATVPSLIDHVNHATEMGHIKSGVATALLAPLNAANNEGLPTGARIQAVQAFTYLVNAQAGKGIPADCANHLLMQAGDVITALNR